MVITKEQARKKICLALDVDDVDHAVHLASKLRDHVGIFKVGLELFSAAGPAVIGAIIEIGSPIFLDLKLHDIPNTVARTARLLTRLGVSMFNVHGAGGKEMVRAAVTAAQEEADRIGIDVPAVLVVTVLTSINQQILKNQLLVDTTVENAVSHYAAMAEAQGAAGVVASPHEIEIVRNSCRKDFLIVTPGVRPADAALGDQKRVTTPSQAITKGSDFVVIGRPILAAKDPVVAAESIVSEIALS